MCGLLTIFYIRRQQGNSEISRLQTLEFCCHLAQYEKNRFAEEKTCAANLGVNNASHICDDKMI